MLTESLRKSVPYLLCAKLLLSPHSAAAALTPEFADDVASQTESSAAEEICEGKDSGVITYYPSDAAHKTEQKVECGYTCTPVDDASEEEPHIPSRSVDSLPGNIKFIVETDGFSAISIRGDETKKTASVYLSEGEVSIRGKCAYDPNTQGISNCTIINTGNFFDEDSEKKILEVAEDCNNLVMTIATEEQAPKGKRVTFQGAAYAKKLLEQINRDAEIIRSGARTPALKAQPPQPK